MRASARLPRAGGGASPAITLGRLQPLAAVARRLTPAAAARQLGIALPAGGGRGPHHRPPPGRQTASWLVAARPLGVGVAAASASAGAASWRRRAAAGSKLAMASARGRGVATRALGEVVRPEGLRSSPTPRRAPGTEPVHVLACATEYRQETAILQRSAARNGYKFHAVAVGEPWKGFATKFVAYDHALEWLLSSGEVLPTDKVILTDAWDTVILGSAQELLQKLEGLPEDAVLGGAEKVCGPNHFLVGDMEKLYPDGTTQWRYPNSGGLVGSARAMADLLHNLVYDTEDGAKLPAEENDQVHLHNYLLARAAAGSPYPFLLDTDCRVFQCMYEEQPLWDVVSDGVAPRLRNRLTNKQCVIAHGNGHTGRWFLSSFYSEAGLLDHLGLTMEELAHLKHEMPVAPGTLVTEEVKAEYCPWWYMPGMHKGATDGFEVFYMVRQMQCGGGR